MSVVRGVLGLALWHATALLERAVGPTLTQRSKMARDREIDHVLCHNADHASVRRMHSVYTTALNGLLLAAHEAEEQGFRDIATDLAAVAARTDQDFAARLRGHAARESL